MRLAPAPSDMVAENEAILARLERKGLDFSAEAEIEFTIDLAGDHTADLLRQRLDGALREAGHRVRFDTDYRDGRVDLLVIVTMPVDADAMSRVEWLIYEMAAPYDYNEICWGFLAVPMRPHRAKEGFGFGRLVASLFGGQR